VTSEEKDKRGIAITF